MTDSRDIQTREEMEKFANAGNPDRPPSGHALVRLCTPASEQSFTTTGCGARSCSDPLFRAIRVWRCNLDKQRSEEFERCSNVLPLVSESESPYKIGCLGASYTGRVLYKKNYLRP